VNVAMDENATPGERVADRMTAFFGSEGRSS
jgi:uncharacterized membrane protein